MSIGTLIILIVYGLLFLLPAFLFTVYYMLLMIVRLCGARAYRPAGMNATHTFAIVIPAHNEEKVLGDTLRSCAHIEYPNHKYDVFVVADNCSDRTVEVAKAFGITCLERRAPQERGKGYALQWVFGQIVSRGYDAVVVLDADCRIDSHALRVFDRCFEEGDQVLQANYITSNPDASPISYAARVGNLLEYELFYAPKSCLGLAVMLVGTGMVFRKEVLETHPWGAHSVVEDAEYTLSLARHGIRVQFVANVGVRQAAAERIEQLKVQRKRWASGTMELSKACVLKTITEGIISRRAWLIDSGWTLLVVSRPLVLLHLSATLGLGAVLVPLIPEWTSTMVIGFGLTLLLAYGLYLGTGIIMVGLSIRRACFLLVAPLVVARIAIISLTTLFGSQHGQWERTPR